MAVVKREEVSLYDIGIGRFVRMFKFLSPRRSSREHLSGIFSCALPQPVAVRLGKTEVTASTIEECGKAWDEAIKTYTSEGKEKRDRLILVSLEHEDEIDNDGERDVSLKVSA